LMLIRRLFRGLVWTRDEITKRYKIASECTRTHCFKKCFFKYGEGTDPSQIPLHEMETLAYTPHPSTSTCGWPSPLC